MTSSRPIDAWIADRPDWQQAIASHLRRLIHQADPDIQEVIKWSSPAFEHAGLVCGFFSAKDWVHFGFQNGALIDDHHHLFASDAPQQAARRLLIKQGDLINDTAIIDYVQQVVANNLAGKKVKFTPEPQQEIVLPPDIRDALHDHGLLTAFEQRPYYQRKDWPRWIEEAKRPETRQRRLDTMLRELRTGEYMAPKGGWPDGQGGRRQLM